MKRIGLVSLAALLASGAAWAGSGTIAVTPGSGATVKTTTDGGGANASVITIGDGTAAANIAAVKAASTAAVAADPAVVVAISPNNTVPVNITAGGITGFASGAAFSGSNILTDGGIFSGNMYPLQLDGASGNLKVNCAAGCSAGTTSNASDAVATSSTNGASVGYGYVFNGTTWDRQRGLGNAGSGVATTSLGLTGGVAYLYGFNGTTWDQIQVDANKNVKSVLFQGAAALSATNGIYANALQGNAVLSLTNPSFAKLTDGTTAVPVKAASTAAVAADPALVVAISPNNTLPVNQTQMNGVAVTSGVGASGTGTQRVAVSTDSPGGALANAAFAQPIGGTTGGATPYHYLSAASTNSTLISTGAHSVYNITAVNTTATLYYLKFSDNSAAPTCGTTAVVHTYPIPASATGAGLTISIPVGIKFASGLGFCITGAVADNDTTSAATGVVINVDYN